MKVGENLDQLLKKISDLLIYLIAPSHPVVLMEMLMA
jgi:hypothetical protein